MNRPTYVLVLNPGSTRTRIALYRDAEEVLDREVRHGQAEAPALGWDEDLAVRLAAAWQLLDEAGVSASSLGAVVGRGGLLRPLAGGVYRVNEEMLNDARKGVQGQHPSNLGAGLAHAIAERARAPALVVDPVSVDEFDDLARLSGLAAIERRSLSHALSIHAAVRSLATRAGEPWRTLRAVVAHLGGGISVCPVRNGRIVDANNAVSEGPYSPQRAGGLPVQELLDLVYSGEYTPQEIRRLTVGHGGLVSYLDTDDAVEVERRIDAGDAQAEIAYRGMAYQVAKEIGAMATVLEGRVDAVILTGGLARSDRLVEWITAAVEFIAPVHVVPVQEMAAMAARALAALRGEEPIREYGA